MGVRLSKHFLRRCREQNIDYKQVRDRVKELPEIQGSMRFRLDDGIEVVCERSGSHVVIKTVVGIGKQIKSRKRRKS